MYEVTVEAGFSSGHYLRNYKGKCENPHGHNYKIRVTLAGTELDPAGLLLDFKLLKHVLRPVIERIDHRMLNDLEPFIVLNPSAENIAKYFYDQTNEQLAAMTEGRVRVKDATIWETDTTRLLTTSSARSGPYVHHTAAQFIWLDFDLRYLSKGISK
jgi:6-pyruvoyltetrahydropterin/6-carboxytetrahydropterin synthase